jgi:hypothetical protein
MLRKEELEKILERSDAATNRLFFLTDVFEEIGNPDDDEYCRFTRYGLQGFTEILDGILDVVQDLTEMQRDALDMVKELEEEKEPKAHVSNRRNQDEE